MDGALVVAAVVEHARVVGVLEEPVRTLGRHHPGILEVDDAEVIGDVVVVEDHVGGRRLQHLAHRRVCPQLPIAVDVLLERAVAWPLALDAVAVDLVTGEHEELVVATLGEALPAAQAAVGAGDGIGERGELDGQVARPERKGQAGLGGARCVEAAGDEREAAARRHVPEHERVVVASATAEPIDLDDRRVRFGAQPDRHGSTDTRPSSGGRGDDVLLDDRTHELVVRAELERHVEPEPRRRRRRVADDAVAEVDTDGCVHSLVPADVSGDEPRREFDAEEFGGDGDEPDGVACLPRQLGADPCGRPAERGEIRERKREAAVLAERHLLGELLGKSEVRLESTRRLGIVGVAASGETGHDAQGHPDSGAGEWPFVDEVDESKVNGDHVTHLLRPVRWTLRSTRRR